MKKRTPVSKIMTTDIITVNTTQTLSEVDTILTENNIRHIPVVSGKTVIGMLSKIDLQKVYFINTVDGDELSIEQVMTKNLTVIQKDDTIYDVADVLATSEFHSLPVLDGEELVGIVTRIDLRYHHHRL